MRFFFLDPVTNDIRPTPEILMIHPFNLIWERAEDKDQALKEMALVYFMTSLEKENMYRDTGSEFEFFETPRASYNADDDEEDDTSELSFVDVQGQRIQHDADRMNQIIEDVFPGQEYVPDEVVLHAIKKMREIYTKVFSYRFFMSAVKSAASLRHYLETVDFGERTRSGGLVHDPNKINTSIQQITATMKGLHDTRERVVTESFDSAKQVKDRSKGRYED